MSSAESFDDPVLGRVVWDTNRRWWRFEVELQSGRVVPGLVDPTDEGLLEQGKGLDVIREMVNWVVRYEPDIRRRVAEAMFEGWMSGCYDEEIDEINTLDGFRETISLAAMNIDTVRNIGLTYNDGNLFGGHMIVLNVDGDGRFVYGPDTWG